MQERSAIIIPEKSQVKEKPKVFESQPASQAGKRDDEFSELKKTQPLDEFPFKENLSFAYLFKCDLDGVSASAQLLWLTITTAAALNFLQDGSYRWSVSFLKMYFMIMYKMLL